MLKNIHSLLSNRKFFYIGLFLLLIVFLIIPRLLGGYRETPYYGYKMMWLNFIGHDFKLPLEAPKPLFCLLCSLINENTIYLFTCLFTIGVFVILLKLSQYFTTFAWPGIVAFILLICANNIVLPDFILPAYWPMLYFFLILVSLYSLFKKNILTASIMLTLSGLMRPEAWIFSIFFILYAILDKQTKFSFWLLLPLSAPVLWMLFDYGMTGNFTYTSVVTYHYADVLGIKLIGFRDFWPVIMKSLSERFTLPSIIIGIIALAYFIIHTKRMEHFLLVLIAITPFFLYWFLSFVKPLVVHIRFLTFSVLILYFYAACLFTKMKLNRWVVASLVIVFMAISIKPDMIQFSRERITNDCIIINARKNMLGKLEKFHSNADLILTGRSTGYFSYNLGEEFSKKIYMFRESIASPEIIKNAEKGIAVYINHDVGGKGARYSFLSTPDKYGFHHFNDTITFTPLYRTDDGNGIMYLFERKKL